MHLRLWQRLFIAFAGLSVLALAGFAAWQQQEFRRGFLGYLDEVALERLQPASVRLANAYAESGSWDFLSAQPNRFSELIDVRPQRRGMSPPPGTDLNVDAHRVPPLPPDGAPPPPPFEFDGAPDGPSPGRPPPHGPPDLMSRLLLLDAGGAFVAGNRNVPLDAPSVPVELEGRRIGTLHLAPLPQFNDALDLAFAREQVRKAMLTGLAVLAGAFVLAFALARWLLKPVHALAQGTRALAAGNYERRVGVERKDELGGLAEDFNHLAATLEQHREARRRWGADIAHELRTPLSVLRGEIQALQDGVRQTTPAALDSLQAECDRLGALIEDLYQLSLADAGALEYRFESIDFAEIVRESLDAQRGTCADAGLSIEEDLGGEVTIRGDARRLTQLVHNLLANARRYTDTPGRIRVELARVREDARLVVEDTAPGVPIDAMPRLFERLYRVESSRVRAAGGAGLGLAICRAIVEAHAGRIDATASPLGGLRITVDLPGGEA